MKKNVFPCLFFLVLILHAQVQNLAELSQGEPAGFNSLVGANEEFFGYIAFFDLDKVDKESKKFEYVLFDRNLNEMANGNFVAESSVYGFEAYFNYQNELIAIPMVSPYIITKRFKYPEAIKINYQEKTVEDYLFYCYEDGQFTNCPPNESWKSRKTEMKDELKANGHLYQSKIQFLKTGDLLVNDWREYGHVNGAGFNLKYITHDRIMVYDENKNLKWEKTFNTTGDKNQYESIQILPSEGNEFFVKTMETTKGERIPKKFLAFSKSGESLIDYDLQGNRLYDKHSQSMAFVDKKDFATEIGVRSNGTHSLGYYRMMLDKKTNSIDWQKIDFLDLATYLKKIDAFGHLGNRYYLKLRRIFVFDDGSTALLSEKFKDGYNAILGISMPKTRDFVLIQTDKDFKVTHANVIEKELSKYSYSDYLFSQELNDGKDFVFFYRDFQKDDETKDKNWVLGINTIINGTFKNQEIPITSDEFSIFPYKAKEGYILLREFNKKQKYNQLRLEKLNF